VSSLLTDSTGHALGYIPFEMVALETSPPVTVWCVASDGASFRSGVSASFRLKARRTSSGDPFEYLDGAGIDLSADAAGPVEFDLECEALSVSGLVRDAVALTVGGSGAAGWDA